MFHLARQGGLAIIVIIVKSIPSQCSSAIVNPTSQRDVVESLLQRFVLGSRDSRHPSKERQSIGSHPTHCVAPPNQAVGRFVGDGLSDIPKGVFGHIALAQVVGSQSRRSEWRSSDAPMWQSKRRYIGVTVSARRRRATRGSSVRITVQARLSEACVWTCV